MSAIDPTRTADHVPTPETLPPDSPELTNPFDPNRTTGLESSAPANDADETVPGYEILGELGRGGMGVVYKARDKRLNRVIALKTILGRPGTAELMRFRAEAEAMAAVRHPHVAQVFEAGEAIGQPYLAMEYLPGGTFTSRIRRNTERHAESIALVAKIASGVAAAHAAGIVHRDLKPANVLFDEAGEPKVTDFGLAKRGTSSDMTATGAIMGTPAYMAPEQAGGNTKFVGPQADVWALGVILYESVTGTRPFAGDDVRAILAAILTSDAVPPRKRNPSVARDLDLICRKCLAKEPHERYPTAKELAADLGRFTRGEPISIRPAGLLERGYKWAKRKPAIAGLYAAAVLGAVLIGVVAVIADSRRDAVNARGEAEVALKGEEIARKEAVIEREKSDALVLTTEKLRMALVNDRIEAVTQRGKAESERARADSLQARVERYEYARKVNLASRDWERGDFARARRLLDECREDLRGWEWHYIHRLCHSDLAPLDHSGSRVIYMGLELGKTLRPSPGWAILLDAASGKAIRWSGGGNPATAMRPGGTQVLRRTLDNSGRPTLKVLDLIAGDPVPTFRPVISDAVWSAEYSPDGSRIVAVTHAGDRTAIRVLDADTGVELKRIQDGLAGVKLTPPHDRSMNNARAEFSPDGKLILWVDDLLLRVWDAKTGVLKLSTNGYSVSVGSTAFSLDASRLVATSVADQKESLVTVWDTRNWTVLHNLSGPRNLRTSRFSPDGTRILTASADGVTLWDAITGTEVLTLKPTPHVPVHDAAFSPNGSWIAATTGDKSRRLSWVWDSRPATTKFVKPVAPAPRSR